MKFELLAFNFINQCNSNQFVMNIQNYEYFTSNLNQKIDIEFLKFIEFDDRFDVIFYDPKLNNSIISYYGNVVLNPNQMGNISRVLFNRKVIDDYIAYLQYSSLQSTEEVFKHFWNVTNSNYKIKIEPAELFVREK